MKRRIIAALMCLCMMVGLLPMSAFAADPGTLTPGDKYYTFNGSSVATADDADITLSKQAVDNQDGTYTVTLSADADQMVMAKKTEVVFVIDGSGSMRWCTAADNACNHGRLGSEWCAVTKYDHSKSRWNIALNAIETMQERLGDEGVSYKYVVYKAGIGGGIIFTDDAKMFESLDEVKEITPNGGTYLSAGVDEALDCFSDGDTNKVMIIVADGDSDDGYPKDSEWSFEGQRPSDFGEFKQNGGEVYTVGFTFSNDKFGAISSEPHKDYNFYATDEDSLNITMDKIGENIKGLITDPMGEKVQLVGGAESITVSPSGNPAAWVAGNTVNWTNTQGLNGKVTLTYTVKVKDGQVQAGHNTIALNGNATLNYTYGESEEHNISFPVPTAEFDAATLTVNYYLENATGDPIKTENEWVNIAWDHTFTTKLPGIGDEVNGHFVKTIDGTIPSEEALEAQSYTVNVILTDNPGPDYADAAVTKTPVTDESVELKDGTTLNQGADYIKVENKNGAYVATAGVDEDSATVLFAVNVIADGAGQVDVTDAGADYVGMSGDAATANDGQNGTVTLTFGEGGGEVTLYFSKTATFEKSNTVTVSNMVAVKDGDGDDTNDNPTSEVDVTKTEAKPSLTVNKTYTISRDGQTVTQGNAKPGDVVTYTITVTNNGNVELSNVTVKDTFTGAKAPDNTWTAANGKFEKTWTIASLDVKESDRTTATYTYTVQPEDAGKTISNTAAASNSDVTTPVTDTETITVDGYTLTYYANGGSWSDGAVTKTDSNLPVGAHQLNQVAPTHTLAPDENDQLAEVVFIGWTTMNTNEKVYMAGEQLPALVESNSVTIPTVSAVYAVWGIDENGDGVADAQQIVIRPADITIYRGGDGYDGVVKDENGNVVDNGEAVQENGLPEPGYYFTLPYELNQTLRAALKTEDGKPVDLSQHLKIVYDVEGEEEDRSWVITRYNDSESTVVGRYIYQMNAGSETQDPVRLQFVSGDEIITSDDIDFALNHLHQTYSMSIYAGAVDAGLVSVEVTVDGEPVQGVPTSKPIAMVFGTLDVRGTTENAVSEPVVPNVPGEVTEITAVAPEDGVTYYVNGSQFPITNQEAVELLSDDLTGGENLLEAKAEETFAQKLTEKTFDFKYLDLVDSSNGNAYVTASNALTIYWPLSDLEVPEGKVIDYSKPIYVVHYEGLDRDFDKLEDELKTHTPVLLDEDDITVDADKGVLSFSTSSFSPFAVVYSTKDAVTDVTVTFKAGDHGTLSGNSTATVAQGESLIKDQIPGVSADTNYTFTGWVIENGDGTVYTDLTKLTISSAVTFVAQYQYYNPGSGYDHYVYYYPNFNGGSVRNEGFDTGDTVTVKENTWLERDGYVFVCWNTEADGSGTRYDPDDTFTMPDHNVYLYAQWQKEKPGPDDTGVSDWLETEEHNAYLTGYPDSTFRADRNMTRAEVAQMFYALLLDKDVTITKSFSDVPDDAWYATAVKTLASLGMMDGYPDGTFRPDEPITRAEFATVGLAFAYDPIDADCSYYDVSASAWYHTYVAQATTYGWIGGYPDNTFRPGNNITRVEVCVIVNNMLGRDADERYIDRHEDELVHFVDLSDSYWGYYTIMEATNTHEYTGSFTNEKWTDVK